MKLSSYLDKKMIISDVKGETISELSKNLIEAVFEKNKDINYDKKKIIDTVLKREEENSTYLGHGIALPHGRIENFNDTLVIIGFPEKKVKIATRDGKEEELEIIILVVADILKSKNILKIMSGISKLALKNKEVLDKIIQERDPDEIIEIIDKFNIEIDKNIIAKDLMTKTIEPAKPTNTLEDIAKRIILENITGLPVVDENNNFLGEITEKELIMFGMPKHTKVLESLNFMTVGEPFEEYLLKEKITTIDEIYRKKDVAIIDKEAPLMEVACIFIIKDVTTIYIVENERYLGLIRREDIIKKILHI